MLVNKLLDLWYRNNKIPHALLFSGNALQLAADYAKKLLDNNALFASGNHPDYFFITPLAGKTIISVDQIRALILKLEKQPHTAKYKVALISMAEKMNINAANALLKTLEEPSGNTIIMLVTAQANLLPNTITSRCQMLRCSNNFVVDFDLKANMQNTLNNLLLGKTDPITVAASWTENKKIDLKFLLKILLLILLERQKNGMEQKIWHMVDQVYKKLHDLQVAPQLNRQLLLESLLIKGTLC